MSGLCLAYVWLMSALCWAMLSPNLATYTNLGLFKMPGRKLDSRAMKAPPKLKLNSYLNCFRLTHANKNRLATCAGKFDQCFCRDDGGGDFQYRSVNLSRYNSNNCSRNQLIVVMSALLDTELLDAVQCVAMSDSHGLWEV